MNDDIKKLYDELINPQNGLNEDEFLEKLAKLEDYTTINIYRTLLSNNDKESVRTSKEYRALKGLNPFSVQQAKKDNIIRNRLERNAINNLVGKKVSISDIINIYSKNIKKILKQKSDIRQKLKKLNIIYDEVGTILPPEGLERITPGSGKGVEKKEGFDRFSLLLDEVLNAKNGFYIGDYRVVIGKNKKNMMRKTSYIVIEIPKINKTIFVNNEYGEATFIYNGIPTDSEIQEKGKQSYKAEFTKIKFLDPTQWIEQVKEALLDSDKGEENRFKDIEARDLKKFLNGEEFINGAREYFKNHSGKKKAWLSADLWSKRLDLKIVINGITYKGRSIVSNLKNEINSKEALAYFISPKGYIDILKTIFGEDDENLFKFCFEHKNFTDDSIRKKIQEEIKDAFKDENKKKEKKEERFSLKTIERDTFKLKINGVTYSYLNIARAFGFEEDNNLLNNTKKFIELSVKIFGEDDEDLFKFCFEHKNFTNDYIRKKIQEEIKDAFKDENKKKEKKEERFSLKARERVTFKLKINGVTYSYLNIARAFGFEEDNHSLDNTKKRDLDNTENFIKLSIAIFGEDDEDVFKFRFEHKNYTDDSIKKLFEKDKNLTQQRFNLNSVDSRQDFHLFDGTSYKKIARIFGIEGEYIFDNKTFSKLNAIIFEGYPDYYDANTIKKFLKNNKETRKKLNHRKRKNFRITDKFKFGNNEYPINGPTYFEIVKIFKDNITEDEEFTMNSQNNDKEKNNENMHSEFIFYRLSNCIFGEDDSFVRSLKEKLEAPNEKFIKENLPAEQRFSLDTIEKRTKFKFRNLSYIDIARIFKLHNEPNILFKNETFIKLSKLIFEETNPNVIELSDKKNFIKQKFIKLLKEDSEFKQNRFYSTVTRRKKFKMDGMTYPNIAKIFGLTGEAKDLYKDEAFIQLSKLIFSNENDKNEENKNEENKNEENNNDYIDALEENNNDYIDALEENHKNHNRESIRKLFEDEKIGDELKAQRFSLTYKKRLAFRLIYEFKGYKINGPTYAEIAKIFEINKNDYKYEQLPQDEVFIRLSKEIFGEDNPDVIELSKKLGKK